MRSNSSAEPRLGTGREGTNWVRFDSEEKRHTGAATLCDRPAVLITVPCPHFVDLETGTPQLRKKLSMNGITISPYPPWTLGDHKDSHPLPHVCIHCASDPSSSTWPPSLAPRAHCNQQEAVKSQI